MKSVVGFLLVLVVLLLFYLSTLQTIPNGSDQYFMRDVGETQAVLNVWGTLHATGYPLYVITGNLLVAVLRGLGIAPATAPALVSLLWTVVALALIYSLAVHLLASPLPDGEGTGVRVILPAILVTLLFGLTRTVWIHASIAEIYSFGLAILALLYLLALWRKPIPNRSYWLALLGGLGVFHHRAIIMAAPALLYAVWPELTQRKLVRTVLLCGLIGLLGFLPYLYLPLRAQADAAWVYGEPGTWAGFWDEFFGREAEQYIGLPDSWDALVANFHTVNMVFVNDLTVPGIALGVVGLLLALRHPQYRRPAITFIIAGATAYAFHIVLYTDILSALILPITLSLAFGWLFLLDAVANEIRALWSRRAIPNYWRAGLAVVVLLPLSWWYVSENRSLIYENWRFVGDLTTDPTGLETIALVQNTPPGATLMLPWGVRHHAVGFARDVQGELQHITLVDHKADFAAIDGMLVTPEYTFYNHPVGWWEERLGRRAYLRAVAPYLVQIDTQPEHATSDAERVVVLEAAVRCDADSIILNVAWYTPARPDHDLSVFVHLLDANGALLDQGDQSAPVYGWHPLTTWDAGEIVRDVYILPRHDGAAMMRYGLYQQLPSGEFQNEFESELSVDCRND